MLSKSMIYDQFFNFILDYVMYLFNILLSIDNKKPFILLGQLHVGLPDATVEGGRT